MRESKNSSKLQRAARWKTMSSSKAAATTKHSIAPGYGCF